MGSRGEKLGTLTTKRILPLFDGEMQVGKKIDHLDCTVL
jgi:hypothetical protein